MNAERDNQIFALPVARYEELPGLARAFARITDEIRRQALDAFMPALGPEWAETSREAHVSVNGLPFAFVGHERAR